MFMRPLLQHASNRTTNGSRRRVIHIELSNLPLPAGLDWTEVEQLYALFLEQNFDAVKSMLSEP
jgi:hypothetical protein